MPCAEPPSGERPGWYAPDDEPTDEIIPTGDHSPAGAPAPAGSPSPEGSPSGAGLEPASAGTPTRTGGFDDDAAQPPTPTIVELLLPRTDTELSAPPPGASTLERTLQITVPAVPGSALGDAEAVHAPSLEATPPRVVVSSPSAPPADKPPSSPASPEERSVSLPTGRDARVFDRRLHGWRLFTLLGVALGAAALLILAATVTAFVAR